MFKSNFDEFAVSCESFRLNRTKAWYVLPAGRLSIKNVPLEELTEPTAVQVVPQSREYHT